MTYHVHVHVVAVGVLVLYIANRKQSYNKHMFVSVATFEVFPISYHHRLCQL